MLNQPALLTGAILVFCGAIVSISVALDNTGFEYEDEREAFAAAWWDSIAPPPGSSNGSLEDRLETLAAYRASPAGTVEGAAGSVQVVTYAGSAISSFCGGTVVADGVVLTAAHCVASSANLPLIDEILVVTGEGEHVARLAADYRFPRGWAESNYADPRFNLALIRLSSDGPAGELASTIRLAALSDAELATTVAGVRPVSFPARDAGSRPSRVVSVAATISRDLIAFDTEPATVTDGAAVSHPGDGRVIAVLLQRCESGRLACDASDSGSTFGVRITNINAAAMAGWCEMMHCSLEFELPFPVTVKNPGMRNLSGVPFDTNPVLAAHP